MADRWVVVAEGDSEQVAKKWWVGDELPRGAECRAAFHGLGAAASVFDMAGAEQIFGPFLAPKGAEVIDCHAEDGVGYVDYRITGTAPLAIMAVIIAAAIAAGFLVISVTTAIKMSQVNPTMFSWQLWLIIIAIIAAIVVMLVLVARKGRVRAGPVTVGK